MFQISRKCKIYAYTNAFERTSNANVHCLGSVGKNNNSTFLQQGCIKLIKMDSKNIYVAEDFYSSNNPEK